MCGYDRVNGTYSCASSDILKIILKEELLFPGYIVSDWDATHATEDYANGGLDMEMPANVSSGAAVASSYFGSLLLDAVIDGRVSEGRLEDMATRVMAPYFLLGQDKDFPSVNPSSGPMFLTYQYGHAPMELSIVYPELPARNIRADHAKVIRKIGAAGTVLLKNTNGTLR